MVASVRMHIRLFIKSFLFAIGLCLAVACTYQEDEVIDYQEIPSGRWDKSEPLRFQILVPDYTQAYSLELLLRHDNRYEYRDLMLSCTITNGLHTVFAQPLMLTLAERPQRWSGEGVVMQQNNFVLLRSFYFPYSGLYTVELSHEMRVPYLTGITEVGLRLNNDENYPVPTILPKTK